MRILFIGHGQMPDYQSDMILHGLRQMPDVTVTDVERPWYLYRADAQARPAEMAGLHGRGFTLYGLLEDDPAINREAIPERIRAHEFDLVIYGGVRTHDRHLDLVLEHYDRTDIVFIDGEDIGNMALPLVSLGLYFKRELYVNVRYVYPIGFAIPESRVHLGPDARHRLMAVVDPRDRSTYVYDTQDGYDGNYREAFFAVTTKKAGWDALRHYEIIAQGAVPYFPDLGECPPLTLTFLPKLQILYAQSLAQALLQSGALPSGEVLDRWRGLRDAMRRHLLRHLTTRAMAAYVLRVREQVKRAPDIL